MTWYKDNFELFDFDSSGLETTDLEINNSGYIYSAQNDIIFQDYLLDNNDNDKEKELLLEICRNENFDYEFIPNDCQLDEN